MATQKAGRAINPSLLSNIKDHIVEYAELEEVASCIPDAPITEGFSLMEAPTSHHKNKNVVKSLDVPSNIQGYSWTYANCSYNLIFSLPQELQHHLLNYLNAKALVTFDSSLLNHELRKIYLRTIKDVILCGIDTHIFPSLDSLRWINLRCMDCRDFRLNVPSNNSSPHCELSGFQYAVAKSATDVLKLMMRSPFYKKEINSAVNYPGFSRNKMTPLHVATIHGNVELIQFLVDNGADPNVCDTLYDESPLHYACRHNAIAAAQILVAAGADCNKTNNDNNTPLMLAIVSEQIQIIRLLICLGNADPNIGQPNDLPLQRAAKLGLLEIIKALVQVPNGCIAANLNPGQNISPYRFAVMNGNKHTAGGLLTELGATDVLWERSEQNAALIERSRRFFDMFSRRVRGVPSNALQEQQQTQDDINSAGIADNSDGGNEFAGNGASGNTDGASFGTGNDILTVMGLWMRSLFCLRIH